jgi:putative ATPase
MIPLATLLRPDTLEDFLGQPKLVGKQGAIRKMIESKQVYSMIFWGPPASGKTTLARIIAHSVGAEFVELSAVLEGKARLKEVVEIAEKVRGQGKTTIVFVDEIHRWSKSQQDALLPYVESGVVTLLGATTENPSFTIISPLLSRSRVFVFDNLTSDEIYQALQRGVEYMQIQHKSRVIIDESVLKYLAELSNGDPRFALNTLQIALTTSDNGVSISKEEIEASANKFLRHDKHGDEHYNLISAVHKSLRSSNATAGVYWIVRMLEAGEDPLYIARRLVRFASEDIGNASPTALMLANAVYDTCKNIGMPECGVAIVQLAEYLARAPKNNSAYTAYAAAKSDVAQYGNLPVPLVIRNAPTKLMKDLEYGKGYQYDHDLETKRSDQQVLPEELSGRSYFG